MVTKATHNISFNSGRSSNYVGSNLGQSETSLQKAENLGCRAEYWQKQKTILDSQIDKNGNDSESCIAHQAMLSHYRRALMNLIQFKALDKFFYRSSMLEKRVLQLSRHIDRVAEPSFLLDSTPSSTINS